MLTIFTVVYLCDIYQGNLSLYLHIETMMFTLFYNNNKNNNNNNNNKGTCQDLFFQKCNFTPGRRDSGKSECKENLKSGICCINFKSFLCSLLRHRIEQFVVLYVVYFDKCLGSAHPKRWSKSLFCCKKAEKARKFMLNFVKNCIFRNI